MECRGEVREDRGEVREIKERPLTFEEIMDRQLELFRTVSLEQLMTMNEELLKNRM